MTARSAANLLEITPNSAALFYRKIREVISDHLVQDANLVDVKIILIIGLKIFGVSLNEH
ncbi:hypothetical protein [Avibacterium sp. 20-129]|uniref:hypothetical protein n=1 Tax=Avibacterium sp. 20-129 TaxID=2911525 RepID=UPI003FA3CB9B